MRRRLEPGAGCIGTSVQTRMPRRPAGADQRPRPVSLSRHAAINHRQRSRCLQLLQPTELHPAAHFLHLNKPTPASCYSSGRATTISRSVRSHVLMYMYMLQSFLHRYISTVSVINKLSYRRESARRRPLLRSRSFTVILVRIESRVRLHVSE